MSDNQSDNVFDKTIHHHADVRFENTTFSTGGIVFFALWFIGILAIIHVLIFGLLQRFERQDQAAQPAVPAVARERTVLPKDIEQIPSPRLQVQEIRDLKQLRDRENAHLQQYDWADREKGTVRIPIDVALRLLSDPHTASAKGIKLAPPRGGK